MFSRLEPLFLKQFRQAESTDTRQSIRDEHKDSRKKREDDSKDNTNESDLWTDSTTVSIKSLQTFLINFLKEQIQHSQTESPSNAFQDTSARPATTMGGHAANAYQTMARRNENSLQTVNTIKNTPDGGDKNSAESEDIRKINHLIRTLGELNKQGIEDLPIPRAGTFLESIESAIKQATKH